MTASIVRLRFQVGARTLAAIPRRLIRIGLSLDEVLAGVAPRLPPLDGAQGYLLTSLPADRDIDADPALLRVVRQRYVRYHADLTTGLDAWLAGLSGNARSSLRRKARRIAEANGGELDVRRYRTRAELAAFHPAARAVSALTYQEKLLAAGLPTGERWAEIEARAATDQVRAWLLFVAGRPVAYLCCTAQGSSLRYDHVGHDPALGDLSPGAVLQMEAMRDLLAERRFARFDFTEGEGQHKRQFATGGTACVDLLLLRPTLANRLALAALAGFDAAVARGRRWVERPALRRLATRLRRA